MIAEALETRGRYNRGVPVQRAADLLYALGTEDSYLLFVVDPGVDPGRVGALGNRHPQRATTGPFNRHPGPTQRGAPMYRLRSEARGHVRTDIETMMRLDDVRRRRP